ncbi:transposase [Nocardia abscessus]|nr:transposase [Nocardia abscessus]MCC3331004.1 transposase [Nocardia abscessus]
MVWIEFACLADLVGQVGAVPEHSEVARADVPALFPSTADYFDEALRQVCHPNPEEYAAAAAAAVITHRRNRGRAGGRPPAIDREIYRHRTTIEGGLNRLKQHRAVATRYEKLATRYLAVIQIAAIDRWL